MKEQTPPKDPKKKLWAGYGILIALLLLSNIFLFPAMMESRVESVNYSTFLQMLEVQASSPPCSWRTSRSTL